MKLRNDIIEPWATRAGQHRHYKMTRRRPFLRLRTSAGWREVAIGMSFEDTFRRGHGLSQLTTVTPP